MKFKTIALLMIILLIMVPFTACSGDSEKGDIPSQETPVDSQVPEAPQKPEQPDKTNINLAVLKGPTGIGAVNLIDKAEGEQALNNYTLTLAGAPDEVTAKIISGEIDIAAVPTNMASVLYNKTEGKVQILGLNTLGVLYLVGTDNTIASLEDIQNGALNGKTIISAGQGSAAEYALDYILSSNGLSVGTDVTVDYKTEHSEVMALLLAGEADIAVLPEPFVTQVLNENPDVNVIGLTEAWDAVSDGSQLAMGSIVVRKEFAEENRQAVKDFLTEYKESIEMANSDIDTTAQLCERYDVIKAVVAEKAIPRCNIVYMDSNDNFQDVVTGFLQVLFDYNPASIGGSMPADDFFYVND